MRANSAIALKQYMRLGSFGQSGGQFPNSVDWSVSQFNRRVGFPTQPTGPLPALLFKSKMRCMQAYQPQPLTYNYTYCYINWQMTRRRAGPRLRANSAIALDQYMRLGSFGQSEGQFPNSVDWSVCQLSRQVGFPTRPTGPLPAPVFLIKKKTTNAGKPTPTVN